MPAVGCWLRFSSRAAPQLMLSFLSLCHAVWYLLPACPCLSEVKLVVANASKLPALLKAMPKFEGQLLGVVYWGEAADDAVKVRILGALCCQHE